MKIVISPYGWGEALPVDVLKLLRDVAFPLNRSMRTPFTGAIVVVPAPHDDLIPRTHYRFVAGDPFFIQLTALGSPKWDQFAYQFSHGLCHVLCDYERLRGNPNNWFHEAICELASVFTLRRMAERWLTDPYHTLIGSDYAESLTLVTFRNASYTMSISTACRADPFRLGCYLKKRVCGKTVTKEKKTQWSRIPSYRSLKMSQPAGMLFVICN